MCLRVKYYANVIYHIFSITIFQVLEMRKDYVDTSHPEENAGAETVAALNMRKETVRC